jgi:cysteine desulfuration protein SufE
VPDGVTSGETIDEARQGLIDDFAYLGDWVQRYEYIVDLGRALEDLDEADKIESHLVPGCQSRVWFHADRRDGRLHFRADSDAIIVRGLIALLLRVYSGRRPDEILKTPPTFFEVLELGSHLSGSRANGLHAMVGRIHAYAGADSTELPATDPTG